MRKLVIAVRKTNLSINVHEVHSTFIFAPGRKIPSEVANCYWLKTFVANSTQKGDNFTAVIGSFMYTAEVIMEVEDANDS